MKRAPLDQAHAGGKWRLSYDAVNGGTGRIEVDMNFMLRTLLWPPRHAECFPVGSYKSSPVPVLDPHELAAGKLAALLSRSAERDIFDAHRLLVEPGLDRAKLRLAFVVYGGINRKDWRAVTVDDVAGDIERAWNELVPMLRADLAPSRANIGPWLDQLISECKERLSLVLPLTPNEREFLERLNGAGEIVPELLTDDVAMQSIIRDHPGLKWKALNVKKYGDFGSSISE